MNLSSVYNDLDVSRSLLYELLREREPHQSISHKEMPTWEAHCAFIASAPYAAWYLVENEGKYHGAVYLTRQREVGIGILRSSRGQGLARQAVAEIMRLHPGKFLANIAPANIVSHTLFRKLGFELLQVTYAK